MQSDYNTHTADEGRLFLCFGKLFDNAKKAHLSKIKAAVQSIAEQKKLIEIHSTGNNMNEPHNTLNEVYHKRTNKILFYIYKVPKWAKLTSSLRSEWK